MGPVDLLSPDPHLRPLALAPMKKCVLCLIIVAVGVGLYFYFGRNELSQISLMEEAVTSIESYHQGGDATETIQKLEELALKLSELSESTPSESTDDHSETKATADRLRGELANASLELELSEKTEARKVSKALDKFIGQ